MQNNQQQPIWNPVRIIGLSFVFTPVFGSYLQASNWRALGHPERAASARKWLYISIAFMLLLSVGSVYLLESAVVDRDAGRGISNIAYFVFYLVWGIGTGGQLKYVQKEFGKQYVKRSFFKPVLSAIGIMIVYFAILIGLVFAMPNASSVPQANNANHTPDQASSSGSSFGFASLLGGAHGLDCADPNVKAFIVQTYGKQLVESGIPDLVWALAENRIKARVDTIHETARNNESKNIDCAANFVIDFPTDDIKRSIEAQQQVLVMQASTTLTDPTFIAPITYQIATPSDPEERKQGPVVTMTTQEDAAVDNRLKTYAADYQALAYATPDITVTSTNSTPWGKAFKDSAVQACGKSADVGRCACSLSGMEKFVGEKQMARIGYALQNVGPLAGNRFPNFKKLAAALDQQCPMTQGLAAVIGDQATAANVSAPSVQDSAVVPASSETQPQTAQAEAAQSAPAAAILASFDCAKASSKIEKLVCSSPETADSDRRLVAAYRSAAAKSPDPASLKQQQRDWLKERNACEDAACLIKTTDARIQVLSTM